MQATGCVHVHLRIDWSITRQCRPRPSARVRCTHTPTRHMASTAHTPAQLGPNQELSGCPWRWSPAIDTRPSRQIRGPPGTVDGSIRWRWSRNVQTPLGPYPSAAGACDRSASMRTQKTAHGLGMVLAMEAQPCTTRARKSTGPRARPRSARRVGGQRRRGRGGGHPTSQSPQTSSARR